MAKFKVGQRVWIIRKDLPVALKVAEVAGHKGRTLFCLTNDVGFQYSYGEESIFPSREAAVEESHANLTAQIRALQQRREDLRNS